MRLITTAATQCLQEREHKTALARRPLHN